MKFAHLVEINDPLNPLIDTLNREQLWRGLVLRAELPKSFIPWLDSCTITEKHESGVSRVCRYGDLTVRDTVTYEPMRQVVYNVPQQNDIPESRLTMTIEEPEKDQFFVRFEYEDDAPEENMDAFYNDFRKSAYEEADIDTIRVIRQMAELGKLG
ncbi:SRPBCC family protein [Noviherbaspirillum galbum]|uniref:DUF1857 family protein n=1 Tax=Noviherbaspirillum galbum TaxID=2709383 RepID=A0A6B3SWU2_9BURK|nr:SRPBCC family protein [Noviherbaspirillum galbum]NEX63476.1 DUF1857 family protein [Noviherbaspirillum galbum]